MFGDLDPTQLSQVVHIMQVRRVRKGQPIFKEGDPGDAWFVIFEGGADVTKATDFGPDKVIARFAVEMDRRGAGDPVGEMAMLDHSSRSASVIASSETTVFRFPRTEFEALLEADNLAAYKLVYQMAKVLTVRARQTTQRLSDALADRDRPQQLRETSRSLVEGQSVSE